MQNHACVYLVSVVFEHTTPALMTQTAEIDSGREEGRHLEASGLRAESLRYSTIDLKDQPLDVFVQISRNLE